MEACSEGEEDPGSKDVSRLTCAADSAEEFDEASAVDNAADDEAAVLCADLDVS
jgi:hypothetical protein